MNKIVKWDATSPSQARTFASCARKWWFEKIEQIPLPQQTGSQSLGSRLHAEIEKWLEKGERPADPLLQPTFDTWLHLFTAPQPYVEYHFSTAVGETGVVCRGYIDFVDVNEETGHVTVWDHKTTRSPRYMKTEDGLWNDPQCLVYLYAVRHLGTSFTFGHHYVRTDRPSAPTFVTVDKTLEQVEEGWEKFVGMTQGMAAVVASGQRPDGNTDACWEYGGCPFRERCNNAGDFSFLYPPAPSAVESTTPMPSIFDPPSTAFSPGEIVAGCIFVYVDCSPMADPPPSFATWVRPLVEKYEAIKHVHPLVEAYQAGIRAVALEAAREWERAPVPLLVASADPIGQLFATLLPASYVVRRLG